LVSSFFALIFQGSYLDFATAALAGASSYLLSVFLDKLETNLFIRGFCCCAAATLSPWDLIPPDLAPI
jgi:uncharacterized membrane protein YjjP (DUF1212 family)